MSGEHDAQRQLERLQEEVQLKGSSGHFRQLSKIRSLYPKQPYNMRELEIFKFYFKPVGTLVP